MPSSPLNPLWITACNAACQAASDAWLAIRSFYRGSYEIFEKLNDGPATEADRLADRLIVESLRRQFPEPEYGYLTEESEDRLDRLQSRRVWIIDPIDGTKEFIAGTGNFCVQIGLVELMDDGLWHPVVGVVYRPILGAMFWGIKGHGAWRTPWPPDAVPEPPLAIDPQTAAPLGAERITVTTRDRIESVRSVLSNTHSTSRLVKLIESLNLESYWHIGSLGVKMAIIAEGGAELYINLWGKTKEWDSAGPHVILNEAGGRLSDLDGNPVLYNQRDVYQHRGLIASNAIIHDAVVELVRNYLKEEEKL